MTSWRGITDKAVSARRSGITKPVNDSARDVSLQKLSNVSGKHLTAYAAFLQATDKASGTVKTDLAAIRFFRDKMDNAKYRLPDNGELSVELEKRFFGGTDRTRSAEEFDKMFAVALVSGQNHYACALAPARFAGLRLHECFRIDTATARQALREKSITIKGKGGKVRTVPIEDERISMTLRPLLAKTRNGGKLLVSDGLPTHIAMQRMEQFIIRNRDAVRDKDSKRPLTFHGLRHTYAAEKYRQFTENGMGSLDAHFAVSRLLGHERPDVTDIYLTSVKEKGRHGD
ncbi:MAG: site-specific integrase [Oscillibacter sp.]|nr:site-specific integrase [Oscillibacter sp.]